METTENESTERAIAKFFARIITQVTDLSDAHSSNDSMRAILFIWS